MVAEFLAYDEPADDQRTLDDEKEDRSLEGRLFSAFQRIESRSLKKKLVTLVETLAEEKE